MGGSELLAGDQRVSSRTIPSRASVNGARRGSGMRERPNKMQLTTLRAAPERQGKVRPYARAGEMDRGIASQRVRVGRT